MPNSAGNKRGLSGRKYTPELHKEVVRRIREGNPKTLASRLVGLNQQTLFDWIAEGRNDPDRYPEYVQLAQDIEIAIAENVAERLARIEAAAKSDPRLWTADAWYLERTMPEEFGRRDRVEVEASAPVIQINQVLLIDAEARAQARELLQRVAAPRGEIVEGESHEVADE